MTRKRKEEETVDASDAAQGAQAAEKQEPFTLEKLVQTLQNSIERFKQQKQQFLVQATADMSHNLGKYDGAIEALNNLLEMIKASGVASEAFLAAADAIIEGADVLEAKEG